MFDSVKFKKVNLIVKRPYYHFALLSSCIINCAHIPLQACYRSPHFQHIGTVPAVLHEW